jgi:PAS domain S-box-containing protein
LRELGEALDELRASHEQIRDQCDAIAAHSAQIQSERARYLALLDGTPQPLLVTDAGTAILEANRPAADLLNISTKYLKGKPLSVFAAEDRAGFLQSVASAIQDSGVRSWKMRLRPRERSVVEVVVHVKRIEAVMSDGAALQWILAPEIDGEAFLSARPRDGNGDGAG